MQASDLSSREMSETAREIGSQPDCWARAADLGRAGSTPLPSPGERVAVAGCGTSLHVGRSYAALREASGAGETDVFLGRGWTVGLADEAALKIREAAQLHAESYPSMEYRHGPISLAGPRTLVWLLGDRAWDGVAQDGIAPDVRATGATVREPAFDP